MKKNIKILSVIIIIIGLSLAAEVSAGLWSDFFSRLFGEEPQFGAPSQTYQKTILPITDSIYNLGAEGNEWLYGWFDNLKIGNSTTTNDTSTGGLSVGSNALVVRDNGNVGIGTATSSYKLDVNGDALINSLGLYDPRNAPLQYPAETVITNLQSGHGYTKQSAAGTQSDDTADYIKGNQSLKLVTDGDASAVVTRKSSISPAIDLTNKYLKVWVKVDNTANVQEFWFYASSNNFSSAWYSWGINDDITQMTNDATSGVWVPITLPFSEASITGSPNRAAINAIQWRVKDKNSTAITANWGGMSALPEPTKGVVSITFDDAWLSQYDEARKKMDEYGFAGTAYIIPDNIGAANFMTLQNLKDLQDKAGWDISAHHQTFFTI